MDDNFETFGDFFPDSQAHTLAECAQYFSRLWGRPVPIETVRKIELRAMNKIRKALLPLAVEYGIVKSTTPSQDQRERNLELVRQAAEDAVKQCNDNLTQQDDKLPMRRRKKTIIPVKSTANSQFVDGHKHAKFREARRLKKAKLDSLRKEKTRSRENVFIIDGIFNGSSSGAIGRGGLAGTAGFVCDKLI